MQRPITPFLAAASLAMLAGCAGHNSPSATPVSESQLQGNTWTVQTLPGEMAQNATLTLNFREDGQLSSKAACNNYMARYQLEGDTLDITPSATTMMACPEPLMKQQKRFLDFLETVESASIQDGRLILVSDGDNKLVASRQDG